MQEPKDKEIIPEEDLHYQEDEAILIEDEALGL